MRRRRPGRPGVTAAATTAVFATGEGPGETALATTAVFATGAPITPTRPTRAGLRGISLSFGYRGLISLDRGDDRLNRNPSGGDQLAARAPRRRCKWRSPQVLPDEHSGRTSRLHRGGQVDDVVCCEQLRELGLERFEFAELLDIGQFHRVDGPIVVLGENQDVDQADRARL